MPTRRPRILRASGVERVSYVKDFVQRNQSKFKNTRIDFKELYNLYCNQVAPEYQYGKNTFSIEFKRCISELGWFIRQHRAQSLTIFGIFESSDQQKK